MANRVVPHAEQMELDELHVSRLLRSCRGNRPHVAGIAEIRLIGSTNSFLAWVFVRVGTAALGWGKSCGVQGLVLLAGGDFRETALRLEEHAEGSASSQLQLLVRHSRAGSRVTVDRESQPDKKIRPITGDNSEY